MGQAVNQENNLDDVIVRPGGCRSGKCSLRVDNPAVDYRVIDPAVQLSQPAWVGLTPPPAPPGLRIVNPEPEPQPDPPADQPGLVWLAVLIAVLAILLAAFAVGAGLGAVFKLVQHAVRPAATATDGQAVPD